MNFKSERLFNGFLSVSACVGSLLIGLAVLAPLADVAHAML